MRFFILIIFLLHAARMLPHASEEQARSIYERAEWSYSIGRIEEAQLMLGDHLKSFSGSLRQSAYRLLSLCSLGLDDESGAEVSARKLLEERPYYSTTLGDPQRFIDMAARISGRGESTITTASSHEERLSEVPVPTTLITEQMMWGSLYRTSGQLRDVHTSDALFEYTDRQNTHKHPQTPTNTL